MRNLLFSTLFLLFSVHNFASTIVSGQAYRIMQANKVLTVENSSLNNSANIVGWTDTEANSQAWILSVNEAGQFMFTNAYTGQFLAYKGAISVVTGTALCQKSAATVGTSGAWVINQVDGSEELYTISPASNTNLCIHMNNANSDGVAIQVATAQDGLATQQWTFEAVDLQSNRLNSVTRDLVMDGWLDKYYFKASVGYILGGGGWWGDAEMFETVLDAFETTGNVKYKIMFDELYNNFVSRNQSNWLYNAFNDDIAWMVLACVRAHLMFGTTEYLQRAQENFDQMYARAAKLPHGMLIWNAVEGSPRGTNSCINGPAEVAACYLAIATGNERYYTIAKGLYAAQRQFLYNPNNGQVYDSFTWDENDTPSDYNYWASTYNQGTYLGAAVMLYNHYKDEMYKKDAQKIMEYTRNNLCDEWGIIKVCQVVKGDLTGFKGILMRYVRRYMVDLNIPEWNDWLSDNAIHAFNNRNSIGVISSAWLTKTTEDMIMGTDDYSNEAFGTSTAVSAAFNTYTDDKTLRKNGFHTIEAENFDYLKGVYVTTGTDDNTPIICDINADDYTAYYNVDFGSNLAKSIDIRVKGNKSRSKIDIRLDSINGQQLANISIPISDNVWQTISSTLINPVDGLHNIYFVYQGVALNEDIYHINSFRFKADGLTYNDITCNGGLLAASWGGEDLKSLIDNRLSTSVAGQFGSNCWIQFQSPSKVKLQGYAVGSSNGDATTVPKSWQLRASTDGEQWITLDTQTNQTFNRQQMNRYDVEAVADYNYFRLVISENNGGENLSLSEWQLYGFNVLQDDITADGGTLTSSADGISALIDKNNTTVFSANDLNATYKSLAKYRLKYYSLTSSNEDVSFDPKDWTLFGSNNGSEWTVIDNRVDQEFLYRGTTQVYEVTPNEDYSYYRLEVKANRGGSTTKLDEWQLFGDLVSDAFVGNITGNGGKIYSTSENHLPDLIDGLGKTTYTLSGSANWIIFESTSQAALCGYSITISDDLSRIPQRVVLHGSNDGINWIQLSSSNHTFTSLGQKSRINFTVKPSYRFFKLTMTKATNAVNDEIRLSGIELYGLAITRQSLITSANSLTTSVDGFSGEGVERLIDGSSTTKYCANFSESTMINYEANEPFVINTYSITSANDEAGRDPKTWTLEASNDGVEWIVIDRRENEQFYYRYDTHFYPCNSQSEAYSNYRLNISENNGTSLLQMSQWELLNLDRHEITVGIEAEVLKATDVFSVYNCDKKLYLNTSERGKISIYNTRGEVVLIDNVYEGETSIDVSILEKGIYIIQLQTVSGINHVKSKIN